MVTWQDLPDYVKEFNALYDAYEEHFGKGSLDRVILPVNFEAEEAFRESIRDLKRAIRTNKPLPQLTQEEWDRLIF